MHDTHTLMQGGREEKKDDFFDNCASLLKYICIVDILFNVMIYIKIINKMYLLIFIKIHFKTIILLYFTNVKLRMIKSASELGFY